LALIVRYSSAVTELIDWYSFRRDEFLCDAFRAAMIEFLSSMSYFSPMKSHIVTNAMESYLDPLLNALVTVHDILLENDTEVQGYDSCVEEDDGDCFRDENEYYKLNEDVKVDKFLLQSRSKLNNRFADQILESIKKIAAMSKGVKPVKPLNCFVSFANLKQTCFTDRRSRLEVAQGHVNTCQRPIGRTHAHYLRPQTRVQRHHFRIVLQGSGQ
jgi:hypothetical protein